MLDTNTYFINHPWKLIGYKLLFPFLNIIYALPIRYENKVKLKEKLFYEKFAKYARDKFRINSEEWEVRNSFVYNLGPFKICVSSVPEYFSIDKLEWNLAYQYFDILYPALNRSYFRIVLGEGPFETDNVFCENGDYVLDAGANLGTFTFLASIKVGDSGHVFAIEPIRFFAKCLGESIEINLSKNISVIEVALGDEDRDIKIMLDNENPMGSGKNIRSDFSVEARQVKLDSIVFGEKKIPNVSFLKMDIEGSERNALLGAKETIFKFKPKLSICTYHLKDDPIVIKQIIKNIEPKYKITMGRKKLYAII